jgi:hypothetical protein
MTKLRNTTAEFERLQNLWATGRATKTQILRCMELDRKQEHARKEARLREAAMTR